MLIDHSNMNIEKKHYFCIDMEVTSLEKALVANPTGWRLAMGIGPDALEVVAYSPMEENTLIHRRVEASQATAPLKALEDAVYDNPLLLADFGHVNCVLSSQQVIVAPVEAADEPDAHVALMKASFPGWSGEIIVDKVPASNAVILTGVDREIAGFLRRTFFNPVLSGRLAVLSRYFLTSSRRVNAARCLVNLRRGSLDIIAVDRGRLLMANTFEFTTETDAVYYILAARRQVWLDDSELLISGDQDWRERLMPSLRRFVAAVMPVIFPSDMFRAGGREAMNSPFELIVLPLCE